MNKTEKVISQIMENEEELQEFLKQDTMEEMYNFILKKDSTITEDEFDKSISEMLEDCLSPEELRDIGDEDLKDISGGVKGGIGTKVASMAASLMIALPGATSSMANAAGTESISNGYSSTTSVDGSRDAGSDRYRNMISLIQNRSNGSESLPALVVMSAAKKWNRPVSEGRKRLGEEIGPASKRFRREESRSGMVRTGEEIGPASKRFRREESRPGMVRTGEEIGPASKRSRIEESRPGMVRSGEEIGSASKRFEGMASYQGMVRSGEEIGPASKRFRREESRPGMVRTGEEIGPASKRSRIEEVSTNRGLKRFRGEARPASKRPRS